MFLFPAKILLHRIPTTAFANLIQHRFRAGQFHRRSKTIPGAENSDFHLWYN